MTPRPPHTDNLPYINKHRGDSEHKAVNYSHSTQHAVLIDAL